MEHDHRDAHGHADGGNGADAPNVDRPRQPVDHRGQEQRTWHTHKGDQSFGFYEGEKKGDCHRVFGQRLEHVTLGDEIHRPCLHPPDRHREVVLEPIVARGVASEGVQKKCSVHRRNDEHGKPGEFERARLERWLLRIARLCRLRESPRDNAMRRPGDQQENHRHRFGRDQPATGEKRDIARQVHREYKPARGQDAAESPDANAIPYGATATPPTPHPPGEQPGGGRY